MLGMPPSSGYINCQKTVIPFFSIFNGCRVWEKQEIPCPTKRCPLPSVEKSCPLYIAGVLHLLYSLCFGLYTLKVFFWKILKYICSIYLGFRIIISRYFLIVMYVLVFRFRPIFSMFRRFRRYILSLITICIPYILPDRRISYDIIENYKVFNGILWEYLQDWSN